MFKFLASVGCGAMMLACVAAPATAADELEGKLAACNACHGQNGQPIDKSIPIIWGQTTAYLVKQLHDYRSEDRANPVMSPLAGTIKPEEWRKVAGYFTAKPWPAKQASTGPAPAAPPEQKIAVCRVCHQQNFEGGLPAPRLAGHARELDQLLCQHVEVQLELIAKHAQELAQPVETVLRSLDLLLKLRSC